MLSRIDILNLLASRFGYQSYLEIGCRKDHSFETMDLPRRVGVDPERGGTVRATSDDFFAQNSESFDLVFIDGLHEAEQVSRDIQNSLRWLRPGGTIVCHDLNPTSELQQRVPRQTKTWTGDCWKAWVRLRVERSDLTTCVVDTDHGCGIIRRSSRPQPRPLLDSDQELSYAALERHRAHWLNLVHPDTFLRMLDARDFSVIPRQHALLVPTQESPEALSRIVEAFDKTDFVFFVHVDRNRSQAAFEEVFGGRTHVIFSKKRHTVRSRGWSRVAPTLTLLELAADHPAHFGYYSLTPDRDFPARSAPDLRGLFNTSTEEFIAYRRLPALPEEDSHSPGSQTRRQRAAQWLSSSAQKSLHALGRLRRSVGGPRYDVLTAPYAGSPYWSLSQGCVLHVLAFLKENPALVASYRYLRDPSELLFQTVVLNSPYRERCSTLDPLGRFRRVE